MGNQTGGCHCGAVKFEISADPLLSAHCQCSDCQKFAGTGHSSVLVVPEMSVSMTGELKEYTVKGDSGNNITRAFCPQCGTPISTKADALPGAIMLKAGALDNPDDFQPQMVIYTKSGPAWDNEIKNGLQTFEEMPPLG